MHIAIDLDDVVLDFVGNLCAVLQREYGSDITPEDITDWDLRKVLDPIVGENWWHWWKERDWLWAQAPAVPGAIGGLRTLRNQGHYLEIVTSKPEWAEAQTWRWLGKWRPPVQRVTIVGMDQKKADVSNAFMLIDDKPENCTEWAETGRVALMYDRPHNRLVPLEETGLVYRVLGWNDIHNAVGMEEEVHT